MKYILTTLLLTAMLLAVSSCEQSNKTGESVTETNDPAIAEKPSEDQPLLLDDEPLLLDDEPLLLDDQPLLLDDESADADLPDMADNSRCHVCHINYQQEDIAVTHAKAGMGCNHCHGESDEHIDDESWARGGTGTPPDRMFPMETINPFCMTCHTIDKTDQPQHKSVFAEGDDHKVCTDCHGKHRLPTRKFKWK